MGGSRSGISIACSTGTVAIAETSLSGTYRNANVTLTFSDGGSFAGTINAPTLSDSLLELRGTVQLQTSAGQATAECVAGPIETPTRASLPVAP